MTCWRDTKGLVHLLDGADVKWCAPRSWTPHNTNTDAPPTCLRCLAAKAHNDMLPRTFTDVHGVTHRQAFADGFYTFSTLCNVRLRLDKHWDLPSRPITCLVCMDLSQ